MSPIVRVPHVVVLTGVREIEYVVMEPLASLSIYSFRLGKVHLNETDVIWEPDEVLSPWNLMIHSDHEVWVQRVSKRNWGRVWEVEIE